MRAEQVCSVVYQEGCDKTVWGIKNNDGGVAAGVPPVLKDSVASALCLLASLLSFPLFVTYTLIYSWLQLCVSVAERWFLSYSQSGLRVSHHVAPRLPSSSSPCLSHLFSTSGKACCFPPPLLFFNSSKQKQPDLSLGDGFLLCARVCSHSRGISQAERSLMCKRKGGAWWQHWDAEGQKAYNVEKVVGGLTKDLPATAA